MTEQSEYHFDRQVKFELQKGYLNGNGDKIRPITYVADYVIYDSNNRIVQVIDVKSPATMTEIFKLKRKLFEMKYKPLTIDTV